MAQRLRVLAVLAEDSGSVPSNDIVAHNLVTLVPRAPMLFSGSIRASGMHMLRRNTCRPNTLSHKIKNK